jgi:hypothetical protein
MVVFALDFQDSCCTLCWAFFVVPDLLAKKVTTAKMQKFYT